MKNAFFISCLLAALTNPLAGLSSGRLEPWVNWVRNPLTIPVTVGVSNVLAETNTTVSVKLSSAAIEIDGYNCTESTNHAPFIAGLKVRREYELTVVASNFTALDMKLDYKANWTPLTRGGRAAKPKEYMLLVDRALNTSGTIYASNPGGSCTVFSNTWIIELTEKLPANWRMEDGSDSVDAAPGDGDHPQIGPGRSIKIEQAGISWSVGLGRLMDGTSAGRLSVRENGLSKEIYSPTNIYFTAASEVVRDEVELITLATNCPVLRQVKSCQTFVDIVGLANSTELRFYFPNQVGGTTNSDGHYTSITGDPFVVWSLTNPAPSTTNLLNIVERRNGTSLTNQIIFDPNSSSATWTLKYGLGSNERVETRGVTVTTGVATNRVETVDVRYAGASGAAYHATENYKLFPWGFELVEVRIDPDNSSGTANDLVTTMNFNTDEENAPHNYGMLDSMVYPDGRWEKRIYGDDYSNFRQLVKVLTPDRDSPSSPSLADTANSITRIFFHRPDGTIWDMDDVYHSSSYQQAFKSTVQSREDIGDFEKTLVGFLDQEGRPGDGITESDVAFVGEGVWTFGEDWGFGYYGHKAIEYDNESPSKVSYVHGGTYDSTNRMFNVGTNEVWEGPDFRLSTIHAGQVGNWEDNYSSVEVHEAEGQQLFGLDLWPPDVFTNRSWRESFIYQKGSLVQREMYVVTGTMTTTNSTTEPVFDLVCKWIYQNDSLGHATNVSWVDGASGVSRVIYSADYRGTNVFDGSLRLWEMDEQGQKAFYSYDSLKRTVAIVKIGLAASGGFPSQNDVTNIIAYDAYDRTLTNKTVAGAINFTASIVYDQAGRQIMIADTNGLVTTIVYDFGGRKVTTTKPDASTVIQENYLNGRLKSITGTGVVNEFHDWHFGMDSSFVGTPFMTNVAVLHTIHYGSSSSLRERAEGLDWGGRVVQNRMPDWGSNWVVEQIKYRFGSLWTTKPQAIYRSYGDTLLEQVEFEYGIDGSTNSVIVPPYATTRKSWLYSTYPTIQESPDRLTRYTKYFSKIGGHWFSCSTNLTFRIENDSTPTFSAIQLDRLNGFSLASVASEIMSWDADTNLTVATTYIDRTTKKVSQVLNSPQSTLDATNITINGLLQLQSTPTIATPTRYYYDAIGRATMVTSPLGYVASTTYNGFGQVANEVDLTGKATSYEYYPNGVTGAGNLKCVTQANGKKTFVSYSARGEAYRTWGDVPYPEERAYNDQGDLITLKTFRGGNGWNDSTWPASPGTADTTTWGYQEHSGLLTNKTDAASQSVSYTYTNRMLFTRTWARGVTSTNFYNHLGELLGTRYSDSTPQVDYAVTNIYGDVSTFSRSGLPGFVSDSSGIWKYQYDHADRPIGAICTNGLLIGITVTNHFNGLYGRDQIQVLGASPLLTNDYRYDAASGRLSVVSNGIYSATYGYLPNSDLLQTTTFKNTGTTNLTTSRSWEFGSRLGAILNQAGSTMVSSHGYQYDSMNRRTRASLEDGSYWQYDYNDRNELTGARRYWPDMYPASGQQFGYGYDNIGNRQSASSGGDVTGGNLRTTTYTANNLNQYTAVTTPGFEDIVGLALATDTVTVNSGATDRKGEYFHGEITVANSSSPVWQAVTVSSGGVSSNGGFVFPKNNQSMTYDLDGNLTFDGTWTYEWDGENRLKTMTMTNVSGTPNAQRKQLEFAYDYMNRRVQKVVSTWSGTAFTSPVTNQFVYDGWNLLAELDVSHSALRTYMWGQDLSGTMGKAGGIGGLLLVADHVPATDTYHFVGYDGNGNVTALVDAANSSISARYEYSAYGELLRSTGPLASLNPFRWSTKFGDDESGLVYYGYRYLSPTQGRWLGRDSIGEVGGINLYGFVLNTPLSSVDPLGQSGGNWMKPWVKWAATIKAISYFASGKEIPHDAQMVSKMLREKENIRRQLEAVNNNKRRSGQPGSGGGPEPETTSTSYNWKGQAAGVMSALGLIVIEAGLIALDAAISHATGTEGISQSATQMYKNLDRGDSGFADLDAAMAALEISGGAGAAAAMAWGVFLDAAGAYSEGN